MNIIRGWIRFEQYRKVYVYDMGSPDSDSVLGSISSNFCEEVLGHAKKLKTEVIVIASKNS